MSVILKILATLIVCTVGVAIVIIRWDPYMIHNIGQGSTLKLKIKDEWSLTILPTPQKYQSLTANSEKLGLSIAIRSGRLFTKRNNENEWSYFTEIIYGDEFSVAPDTAILMDGKEIHPKEKTQIPLEKLYKFEPDVGDND